MGWWEQEKAGQEATSFDIIGTHQYVMREGKGRRKEGFRKDFLQLELCFLLKLYIYIIVGKQLSES